MNYKLFDRSRASPIELHGKVLQLVMNSLTQILALEGVFFGVDALAYPGPDTLPGPRQHNMLETYVSPIHSSG
jgi:hypothetical protein